MAELKIHFTELDSDSTFIKLSYVFNSVIKDNCIYLITFWGQGKKNHR